MLVQVPPMALRLDAAARLGVVPLLCLARHRFGLRSGAVAASLGRAGPPDGPFLQALAPAPPPLPSAHRRAVLSAAAGLGPAAVHGPFDPGAPALSLDLFAPGDVRPVWEANRLAWLPLLVQAHRLDPSGGHLARAEARLAAWIAANPPWRGPNWACGQEAAIRALHLALSLALLGGPPTPGMTALLRLHARRIAATRHYARAQDNNHPVSEAAGLLAVALALGDAAGAARAARDLAAVVARLVAPDGAFAVVSTGYHRLLLDTLAVTEWLRRFHGGPPLPDPIPARAFAATRWLARLICGETGRTPRLGHQDGSCLADLSLRGPDDARGSVERAARLFGPASAGVAEDPGSDWLALPPGPPFPAESEWAVEGTRGWRDGPTRLLLRTGPLRFRPGHADLLHLDLWHGPANHLRDAGTGTYNPSPDRAWWADHFPSAYAHNTITFDDAEPMPRAGRFLFARWPATESLPDGAATRDARGNRHARTVRRDGEDWIVEDRVSGPFRTLALRWHLAPGEWRIVGDALLGPSARLAFAADAPFSITLERSWESRTYGEASPIPCVVLRAASPVTHVGTRIGLSSATGDCKTVPGAV